MNEFGYAFSAQLRGAGQISSGKTLTATGLAMFLASKEPDFATTEWSQTRTESAESAAITLLYDGIGRYLSIDCRRCSPSGVGA